MPAAELALRPPAPGSAEPERPPILAFVADEESEAALRAGLADRLETLPVRRGDVRDAARTLAREPTPRLLIVDVSGGPDALEALDRLAAVSVPDVTVLAIGDRPDIGFYRELTQGFGVAEYLFKPLTRDNVARLFGARLAGAVDLPARRGGRVVTVMGARGGAGATTVAVSLAVRLSELSRGHVLLLDLHLRGGAAAMMLGAKASGGLRVALEDPDRADRLFLDRATVPLGERLHLLAADEPPDSDPAPTAGGARRLLEQLQLRYNAVVVDLPHPPGPVEREVLAQARHRLVVAGPDLVSLRNTLQARRALAALPGTGLTLTVVNRMGARGGLPRKLVVEGLAGEPDLCLPDLPGRLPEAANLGKPAVRDCAALRNALAPLVQELSGVRAAPSRPLFGRLLGRRPGRAA